MLGVEDAPNLLAHNVTLGGSRRKSRTVDIASIEALDRDDCIERWRQMFVVMPPKYTSLEFMRKALCYEAQVKTFGGHSNAVQRALKGSLKTGQPKLEANNAAELNGNDHATIATVSYAEPEGVIERSAPNAHQTIRHDNSGFDVCDPANIKGRRQIEPNVIAPTDGNTKANASPKPNRPAKPSILTIRTGTHLVREWNGRTYQVEALEKGFRLDGKIYRSLSATAKKITGAHWSGPRFFGLES